MNMPSLGSAYPTPDPVIHDTTTVCVEGRCSTGVRTLANTLSELLNTMEWNLYNSNIQPDLTEFSTVAAEYCRGYGIECDPATVQQTVDVYVAKMRAYMAAGGSQPTTQTPNVLTTSAPTTPPVLSTGLTTPTNAITPPPPTGSVTPTSISNAQTLGPGTALTSGTVNSVADGPSLSAGLDTKTLLLIGGAALALFMLSRNR